MEKNSSTRARTEIEKRCAAERRKLARFLSKNGLNEEKIKSLDPVILNVSWMKSKLDDARTAIGEDGLIAPAGKGVHSDRRPGVCCDGVNQTYHVPLRVVDAHGLTEGTGGGG